MHRPSSPSSHHRARAVNLQRPWDSGYLRSRASVTAPEKRTGDVIRRNTNKDPAQDLNLDAPPAGTSQTLTINTSSVHMNELDGLFRIFVIGIST